jgi:hypothetical protein
LRAFYARCLGRSDEQEPPELYGCSTVEHVAAAVAGALADGGRRGVRITAQSAEVRELTSCLRGDLRIEPARIAGHIESAAPELQKTGWLARWPEDGDALAGALALGATYPHLLADLDIGIAGDVAEAATATLERLGAEGLTPEELPDMLIRPAAETDTLPIADLPEQLAKACEQSREFHELWIGDDHGEGAASGLIKLGGADSRHVALLGDELEGLRELAGSGPVTLVTGAPLVRSVAAALNLDHPVRAVAREDSAAEIAGADVIAVDGRRPEDLWLARVATAAGTVVIAHGTRHTAASLAAFGLAPTAVDEATGTVLATAVV